ncbi:acyltransferase family protein, partial [Janibacter sp. LM]
TTNREEPAGLGWVGLAAVVAGGFLLSSATAWPGYAALVPTLGSAAVIVSGFSSSPMGPGAVLSLRPMVWVGGLSYSLYLWHWPLLVSAESYWDGLSLKRGLAVAAFSVIPAYLSYRFIENPIRFSTKLSVSNPLSLSMGANFSAIGVVAGLVLVLAVPASSGTGADGGAAAPGAAVLHEKPAAGQPRPGTVASLKDVEGFVPDISRVTEDLAPMAEEDECQAGLDSSEPIRCEYGDPDGKQTILVVGDSKILQWQTVLDELAKENGWKMVSYTKSACAFSSGVQLAKGKIYTSCADWNSKVRDIALDMKPDLVLTTSRIDQALEDPDDLESLSHKGMTDALAASWQELDDHGIPVLAILDNPSPGIEVYKCAAEHMDDLAACTFDKQEGVESSSVDEFRAAAKKVPSVRIIDFREAICPEKTCVPVIGGVFIYRQTSHVTDTYTRTMKPDVEKVLVPAVEKMTR